MPQPSASFYREQAERLTFLAAETANPAMRIELLEIAASFHKLADHAAANSHATEEEDVSQSV
ncbi:MAG TPA: hypothetical protein VHY80_21550 [Stellaceae bacterium]|jgi:hypothetical protein|nr:hypothetical protein [Stellaceae bacterium]